MQDFKFSKTKSDFLQNKTRQNIDQKKLDIYVNLFIVMKIIVTSDTNATIQENIDELHIQYPINVNSFILGMDYNTSAYDNHLILRKIAKQY